MAVVCAELTREAESSLPLTETNGEEGAKEREQERDIGPPPATVMATGKPRGNK